MSCVAWQDGCFEAIYHDGRKKCCEQIISTSFIFSITSADFSTAAGIFVSCDSSQLGVERTPFSRDVLELLLYHWLMRHVTCCCLSWPSIDVVRRRAVGILDVVLALLRLQLYWNQTSAFF